MIDAEKLATLREIAQKAPSCEWHLGASRDGWYVRTEGMTPLCVAAYNEAVAIHIAAFDPPTVLSLLDALDEALTEVNEEARLNGMGSDREAKLMSERDSARALLLEAFPYVRGTMQKRDGSYCDCAGCEAIRNLRARIANELKSS
jgi:hypothetical protein